MSRKVLMAQDMDPAGKNLLVEEGFELVMACLLYTSDAADE